MSTSLFQFEAVWMMSFFHTLRRWSLSGYNFLQNNFVPLRQGASYVSAICLSVCSWSLHMGMFRQSLNSVPIYVMNFGNPGHQTDQDSFLVVIKLMLLNASCPYILEHTMLLVLNHPLEAKEHTSYLSDILIICSQRKNRFPWWKGLYFNALQQNA